MGWWPLTPLLQSPFPSYRSVLLISFLVALVQTALSSWDCVPLSLKQKPSLQVSTGFTMQLLNHNCLPIATD